MSFSELSKHITILFGVSFVLLTLHILDDALVVSEASWYGITTAEFLLYLVLICSIVPPLGLWLARRGSTVGMAILLVYALQAFCGAGLNHVRHLLGDFRGSQTLNNLLGASGFAIGNTKGQGFWSLAAGMLGLNGGVPPHTHNLFSNVVVFLSMVVNVALLGFLVFGLGQQFFAWERMLTDGKGA